MSKNIGIIGGGNMGAAIIAGICSSYRVRVCESDLTKVKALRKKYDVWPVDVPELVASSEVIILAVKPQNFPELLAEIKGLIHGKHLIISIAAGITTKVIEKILGQNVRVVRVMPNLPAQVGQGMTAVAKGKKATSKDAQMVCSLFDAVGKTIVVDEKQIDAITAVSGSGPAYVFLFTECLINSARKLGFPEKEAQLLVMQTLKGSLAVLEKTGEPAGRLRERVTSKGGTTQAALDVFKKNNFEWIFVEALKAAKRRATELAK